VVPSWLWIVFTLVGAFSQTLRNFLQRSLTGPLGTAGATHVRFFYGLPFGILFLVIILVATGEPLPAIGPVALAWTAAGALTQIAATAMLLMAMQGRSFVVVTAYIKTEPVLVAIFGLVLLGDHLSPIIVLAIIVATAGVIAMSYPKRGATDPFVWRPALLGVGAAGLFGLSAVGFRGGILALGGDSYLVNASTTLVIGLVLQTLVLTPWLLLTAPEVMRTMLKAWRISLPAGFTGAFASQAWFLAFAIESAARVRTLALVEIFFAQFLAGTFLRQHLSPREWAGIALVAVGVILLLNG
jgi:drug/metabolite transporter (DMT)-like permease